MWHRYLAGIASRGNVFFSIRLHTTCTNNLAEYEAVHRGMELLLEAGAEAVEIFGDSKLVISQLTKDYRCESELLRMPRADDPVQVHKFLLDT
jgi:ribonuclease HI